MNKTHIQWFYKNTHNQLNKKNQRWRKQGKEIKALLFTSIWLVSVLFRFIYLSVSRKLPHSIIKYDFMKIMIKIQTVSTSQTMAAFIDKEDSKKFISFYRKIKENGRNKYRILK